MDLSWRRGPMRKRVDDRERTFPNVYNTAKATMLTKSKKVARKPIKRPVTKQTAKPVILCLKDSEGQMPSMSNELEL